MLCVVRLRREIGHITESNYPISTGEFDLPGEGGAHEQAVFWAGRCDPRGYVVLRLDRG